MLSSSMRPLALKLLFRLRHGLFLQLLIELAASLNVRLLSASNELLSVLASLCQTPNAVFAQGQLSAISNCILAIPLIPTNSRFQIDNFGSSPYAMIHLEIFTISFPSSLYFDADLTALFCVYYSSLFSPFNQCLNFKHVGDDRISYGYDFWLSDFPVIRFF